MKYILFTVLAVSFMILPVYYTQATQSFNYTDTQKQLGAMVLQLQTLQNILNGIFTDVSAQTLLDDNGEQASSTCAALNDNIAPCAIASASSVWSSDYTAAKANDDNNLTRWNSARGDTIGAWLALDFGTSTTFNKIVVSEAIPRITSYFLQSWDGLAWQNVISGTMIGAQKTHTFTPITSEKVRLLVTGMEGGPTWVTPTFYEFEVQYEAPKFILGDSIQTVDDLKVRSAPSTTGFLLGIQSVGSQGKVIDGPIYADGYIWWKVDYDVIPDGWSAQNWMEKIQIMPPSLPNTVIINQLLTLVRQAIELEAADDQNLSSILQEMEILLLQLQNGQEYISKPFVERVIIPQTVLVSGNQSLYKFRITAESSGDVALHKFSFDIAKNGVSSLSNLTLWNVTDNKRVASSSISIGDRIVEIFVDTTDYATPWITIPAASSRTFELRANVITDGVGDSVSTKLLGDSELQRGTANQINASAYNNFIWSDFTANVTSIHTLDTDDWANGYQVPGLPASGLDASVVSN